MRILNTVVLSLPLATSFRASPHLRPHTSVLPLNANPSPLDIPKRAVDIYSSYVSRLWKDTNPEAREKVAQKKALRDVQHTVDQLPGVSNEARDDLSRACDQVLDDMEVPASSAAAVAESVTTAAEVPKKKKSRSVLLGALMGCAVACWVFCGNYIFTGIFTLMTLLGQLEYYRMVLQTGVSPARRISVVGSCSMFITALVAPDLHELCLPLFGLYTMIYFLTMKRTLSTIPEIATTFTGMFYLGYVPSFWVRVRTLGTGLQPSRIVDVFQPVLAFLKTRGYTLSISPNLVLPVTTGSVFVFWTWLSLAFSDVGAYFVGRRWGRTKLGQVAPAAGATSPNKTVEGVIGGCLVSGALSMVGAKVQNWPFWPILGGMHGILLGLMGLIGDLTASMMKRDAGVKDCGDLIPEHGGILDRVDSFIWTAPYSWLLIHTVIPFLRTVAAR